METSVERSLKDRNDQRTFSFDQPIELTGSDGKNKARLDAHQIVETLFRNRGDISEAVSSIREERWFYEHEEEIERSIENSVRHEPPVRTLTRPAISFARVTYITPEKRKKFVKEQVPWMRH